MPRSSGSQPDSSLPIPQSVRGAWVQALCEELESAHESYLDSLYQDVDRREDERYQQLDPSEIDRRFESRREVHATVERVATNVSKAILDVANDLDADRRIAYLKFYLDRFEKAGYSHDPPTKQLVEQLSAALEPGTPSNQTSSRPQPDGILQHDVPKIPWRGSATQLGQVLHWIHDHFVKVGADLAQPEARSVNGDRAPSEQDFVAALSSLFVDAKRLDPFDPNTVLKNGNKETKMKGIIDDDLRRVVIPEIR